MQIGGKSWNEDNHPGFLLRKQEQPHPFTNPAVGGRMRLTPAGDEKR